MFRADLIRQRREELPLTKEALAVAIGRSYGSISLYESGAVVPPIPVLERIADALDTPIEVFFQSDQVAA